MTVPTPEFPAAGALADHLRPVFRWSAVPGAAAYDVEVTGADGASVLSLAGVPATELAVEEPLPLGALTWRVRAAGGDWSAPVAFRASTESDLDAARADEARAASEARAAARREAEAAGATATAPEAPPAPAWPVREGATLPGGAVPDWRRLPGFAATPARADEPAADGLAAPRPVAPLGGEVVDGAAARFLWQAVPGATSYDVEISPDRAFASDVLAIPGVGTVELAMPGVLPDAGAQMHWRVRARSARGVSPWSLFGRFYPADESAATLYRREADAARAAQAKLDTFQRARADEADSQLPIYEREGAVEDPVGLWLVFATVGLATLWGVFILVASLVTL